MTYRPFDLTGKVALVTGGNGGIGLGMANGLAAAGSDVVIWGINAEKNAAARQTLEAYGGRVTVTQVDVTNEAAVVAGIGKRSVSFVDMSTDDWNKVMAVNLDGVFWTLREACRHMAERSERGDSGGSLLAVSSTSAIHGAPTNQAYAASKGALLSLIRGIAVEYGRHDIRANAVLPGWTRSEMTLPLQQWETFNRKAIGRVPVRRWGEPEDFGGIAVYLASDASRFHTGDAIVIDGGYTIF